MKRVGLAKFAYLALLSQPAQDRTLYRAIRRRRVAKILEIGVGRAVRSRRMIEAASLFHAIDQIHLVGIDLFEARPAHCPGLTLKRAHRMLTATGARIRLVPGDPYYSLARTANSLVGTDLVVIDADQDPESLGRAWFYFPRMLHAESLVFRAEKQGFALIGREEIEQLARPSGGKSGRAA